jgi:hypothetical protein
MDWNSVGKALVVSMPMIFTASHTKFRNFFSLSEVQDHVDVDADTGEIAIH